MGEFNFRGDMNFGACITFIMNLEHDNKEFGLSDEKFFKSLMFLKVQFIIRIIVKYNISILILIF